MSFYDIVMLVVLIGAIGFGFWKGLAWQIASVAAIVVSYIVSVNFREQVAQFIQAPEPWNKIGAMLILFVGCSLAIWIAYAYVTKSMERMELKSFDRQIGALVGGVTGVLLCMAITMFSVSLLGDQAHEAIHDSKLGPHVVQGIRQVHSILPPEVAIQFDKYIQHFEEEIGHGLDQAPAGYSFGPTRQADGAALPAGGFQGNWGNTNPADAGQGGYGGSYSTPSYRAPSQLNRQSPVGNNGGQTQFYGGQTQPGGTYPTNTGYGQPTATPPTGTNSGWQYPTNGGLPYNSRQAGGVQPNPVPPTTQNNPANKNGFWPNFEIKIDSEKLINGLLEKQQ